MLFWRCWSPSRCRQLYAGRAGAAGEEDAAPSSGQALSHQVSRYPSLSPPFPAHFLPSLGVFPSRSVSRALPAPLPPGRPGGILGAAASCIPPLLPGNRECSSPRCPSPGRGLESVLGGQGVPGSAPRLGHSLIRGC